MGRKEKHFGRFFAAFGASVGFVAGAALNTAGGPSGLEHSRGAGTGEWRRDAARTGRRGRLPYEVLQRIG
jgi:hypothetical protein